MNPFDDKPSDKHTGSPTDGLVHAAADSFDDKPADRAEAPVSPFAEEALGSHDNEKTSVVSQHIKAGFKGSLDDQGMILSGAHRVSPYVLIQDLRSMAVLFAIFLIGTIAGNRSFEFLIIIVLINFLSSLVKYISFSWELKEEELILRSGLFNKKQAHIPYAKIHSINTQTKGLDRILGFATLSFSTAGAVASNIPNEIGPLRYGEVEQLSQILHGMSKGEQELRPEDMQADSGDQAARDRQTSIDPEETKLSKLSHKASDLRGIFAGKQGEMAKKSYQFSLSKKELLVYALSHANGFYLFVLFLIVFRNLDDLLSNFNIDTFAFIESKLEEQVSPEFATHQFMMSHILNIVILILAAFVAGFILSAIINYIKGSNFRLSCTKRGFEIKKGIFNVETKTGSLRKIQALTIKQGLIYRLMGYAKLELNLVSEELDQTVVELHPCISEKRCAEFIQQMLPFFAQYQDMPIEHLPAVALKRRVIRALYIPGILLLLSLLALYASFSLLPSLSTNESLFFIAKIVLVLLFLGFVYYLIKGLIEACLSAKHSGTVFSEGLMVLHKQGIRKEIELIQRNKLQYFEFGQNPFERRQKVAHLTLSSAGIASSFSMRDLDLDFCLRCLNWVKPRGVKQEDILKFLAKEDLLYPYEEEAYKALLQEEALIEVQDAKQVTNKEHEATEA